MEVQTLWREIAGHGRERRGGVAPKARLRNGVEVRPQHEKQGLFNPAHGFERLDLPVLVQVHHVHLVARWYAPAVTG